MQRLKELGLSEMGPGLDSVSQTVRHWKHKLCILAGGLVQREQTKSSIDERGAVK